MPKRLYSLNAGDRAIIEATLKRNDPNIFLNYYLRSETSGTWWLPGAQTERWSTGYDNLYKAWKKAKKTPGRFKYNNIDYQVVFDHEKSFQFPDHPAFFHNHGIMMLPWSVPLYNDRTPVRSIVGGFGSGKSMNLLLAMLVRAATLPGYRGFALAPLSMQSNEFHKMAVDLIAGTLYEERFLVGAPSSPVKMLKIGHDGVGHNTIECYPMLNNAEKIRTLTGDEAIFDQAEKEPNLEEVMRSVGTRFRGRVPKTGRERIGTLTFIANSGDNQQLWDIYDKAETEPENYKSLSPSSYDNIFLTDRDLRRFELLVGESEELKDQYLHGARPLGNGEHFSRAVLEQMRDTNLDRIMENGLNSEESDYICLQGQGVGVYEWLLPYKEDHQYLVISDPGTANPPHRDSPPIFIWDITDFPGTRIDPKPAYLAGFVWVYGGGSIDNWASRYAEMVHRYKAYLTNGFDATGFQSGYDEWLSILEQINPEKINLAGNGKWMCLNAGKVLTANQMMKMPVALSHVFGQLARYEYPEPNNLRQDLVMAFIMSAWWLQRLYFYNSSDDGLVRTGPKGRSQRHRRSRHRTRARSR